MNNVKDVIFLTMGVAAFASASPSHSAGHFPIAKLDYMGEYILPNDETFAGVPVGGLSGIDYNPITKQWLLISDDRVEKGPARAYLGQFDITADHVGTFTLDKMIKLVQPDGRLYPDKEDYLSQPLGAQVPDFESIRFNPFTNSFRYTSEGDRSLALNPFIRDAKLDGQYLDELPIPDAFKFHKGSPKEGFYNNLALEGSSFTPDGAYYFAAMEAPLIQDGAPPSLTYGADSRVIKYDQQGRIIGQYVYSIDSLPAKPGIGMHADNGVSEILAEDENHLLVLERAGIQDQEGHYHNYIRLYQTDLSDASNVIGQTQLMAGQYQAMHKRLLLNLNEADLPKLDNIEGVTFGPRLANGQATLVLLSDNNFNDSEITQFLVFKISLK